MSRILTIACIAGWSDQDLHAAGHQGLAPYLHDGRLLTLADSVKFFNLVLGLKLTDDEKQNLITYMLTL